MLLNPAYRPAMPIALEPQITAKLGEQENRLKDINQVKAVPRPKSDEGALALLRWLKVNGANKKR